MRQMLIFWILIILSTIVSVVYLVLGLVFHVTFDGTKKKKNGNTKQEHAAGEKQVSEPEDQKDSDAKPDSGSIQDIVEDTEDEEEEPENEERLACIMRFTVMLLCPVIGPAFFLIGHLMYRLVFHKEVDLADVVFSKERVRTNVRADEERERDIVPVEEALAVSDKSSLRTLMLNVIRGDVQSSLAAISLALNSHDSETAHYAASVLQDELNDFRFNVQKVFQEIEFEPEDETEFEEALIPYMNNVLVQRVFTEMEQKKFVFLMSDAGEYLYRKNASKITSQFYEWISLRLLDVSAFDKMEIWCNRAAAQYPDELASFTCKLKLYFTSQQREKFFQVMEELKESEVVIDSETLELIRTFS